MQWYFNSQFIHFWKQFSSFQHTLHAFLYSLIRMFQKVQWTNYTLPRKKSPVWEKVYMAKGCGYTSLYVLKVKRVNYALLSANICKGFLEQHDPYFYHTSNKKWGNSNLWITHPMGVNLSRWQSEDNIKKFYPKIYYQGLDQVFFLTNSSTCLYWKRYRVPLWQPLKWSDYSLKSISDKKCPQIS